MLHLSFDKATDRMTPSPEPFIISLTETGCYMFQCLVMVLIIHKKWIIYCTFERKSFHTLWCGVSTHRAWAEQLVFLSAAESWTLKHWLLWQISWPTRWPHRWLERKEAFSSPWFAAKFILTEFGYEARLNVTARQIGNSCPLLLWAEASVKPREHWHKHT